MRHPRWLSCGHSGRRCGPDGMSTCHSRRPDRIARAAKHGPTPASCAKCPEPTRHTLLGSIQSICPIPTGWQMVATSSLGSLPTISMGKTTDGGSRPDAQDGAVGAALLQDAHGALARHAAAGDGELWQLASTSAGKACTATSPGRGSFPAADAGAARAAASEDAAAGHARPADEPTPERGAQAKRARGGSGAGMQPKQLFGMAAAEKAAATEGAGSGVEGLKGLEGGMLLEWADMELGAADSYLKCTAGSTTAPSNPSPSPLNPSPPSPSISPCPSPEPTDRRAGMATGHGKDREHEDGSMTSPPLDTGVRGCVTACEQPGGRAVNGRSLQQGRHVQEAGGARRERRHEGRPGRGGKSRRARQRRRERWQPYAQLWKHTYKILVAKTPRGLRTRRWTSNRIREAMVLRPPAVWTLRGP